MKSQLSILKRPEYRNFTQLKVPAKISQVANNPLVLIETMPMINSDCLNHAEIIFSCLPKNFFLDGYSSKFYHSNRVTQRIRACKGKQQGIREEFSLHRSF